MQQDFHFDVVYALCRCSGLEAGESRTVAAASQYTDHCTFAGPLRRPGGEAYRPTVTYPSGIEVIDRAFQASVLGGFHFAGGEGAVRVVLPGNASVTALARKAAVLAGSSARYGLHALGIALHVLVDSFSHQGFSPFLHRVNATTGLDLVPRDPALLESIQGFFLSKLPFLPPLVGHAQAGYCPDIPFLRWTHRTPPASAWTRETCAGVRTEGERVVRDNAVIAAEAAAAVALALACVPGLKPARDLTEQAAFFSCARFRRMDSLRGRSAQWRALFLADRFFDFRGAEDERHYLYDGKEWLGRAHGFAALPRGPAVLTLRRGYTRTDWWRFQQAVRWVKRQN
jgi:hypothetical protein